jgi:hypothetical protein
MWFLFLFLFFISGEEKPWHGPLIRGGILGTSKDCQRNEN